MKLYTCTSCHNTFYFENFTCLNCQHMAGFDPEKFNLVALDNNQNGFSPVNNKNENFRFCLNAVHGTYNWLIPVTNASPFCKA